MTSPAERLAVSVDRRGDEAVVRAAGGLDAASGNRLAAAADELIRAGCRRVVLDLSGISSADLPGVRVLVELGVVLERAGVALTISHAETAMYPLDWHSVPNSHDPVPPGRVRPV